MKVFQCTVLREMGLVKGDCCVPCHDPYRGDTSPSLVDVAGMFNVPVCCHVARELRGETFSQQIERESREYWASQVYNVPV